MSKAFSVDRFRTAVADWIGTLTDPGTAALAAPSGSLGLIGGGSTHELYLKTGGSGGGGWTQQNLLGLRVFNIVRDFGAVGDNATDNATAINNAITAANAAGGGIVYIPPGQYVVLRAAVNSFDLSNVHNITFFGDGHVSQLLMKGNLPDATNWRLFRLHNFTSRIRFVNLYIDASQVTIAVDKRIFPIQLEGSSPDAVGSGTKEVLVEDCFFGEPIGDVVRLLGEDQREVSEVNIRHNVFNCVDALGAPGARSCISVQRGLIRNMIRGNFIKGSHDNEIDFKPTGAGEVSDFLLLGNHVDHQDQATQAIAIGGVSEASPAFDILVAQNVITNGGNLLASNILRCAFVGNIVLVNNANETQGALRLIRRIEQCQFSANILYTLDTVVERHAVSLVPTAVVSPNNLFIDNVIRGNKANNGCHFESCTQLNFIGNVLTMIASGAVPEGIRHRSVAFAADQICMIGNLVVPDNAVTNIIIISAGPQNTRNVVVASNYLRNPGAGGTGINFAAGGGGAFVGNSARYAGDNLLIGGGVGLTVPANGATIIGPAGPGAQGNSFTTTPLGAVSSPPGSFAANTAGGDSNTLFQKETTVDATGWVSIGTFEVEFGTLDTGVATAARFLAPGIALAAASATELQIAITRPCTIRNWRVKQVAGVGAGTITYTMRKNGVSQSTSITINFTDTTGGPTGTFTAVAGDLISVQIAKSVAPGTAATFAVLTFEVAG